MRQSKRRGEDGKGIGEYDVLCTITSPPSPCFGCVDNANVGICSDALGWKVSLEGRAWGRQIQPGL
jgi:hypothetical protein